MQKITRPNLFIVGEPKTGTTALYYFFKQHPQVYVPEQKELNYFARDLIRERFQSKKNISHYFNVTMEQYLAHFNDVKKEKLYADITPIYLYSKKAAKRIHDFNKNSKIIAIFREPVDFLVSLHSQFAFGLVEKERNFERAISLEKKRKNAKEFSFLYYSEWIRYAEQLTRYLELFPKENVKVLIYEDFRDNNSEVFEDLAEFLNIDKKAPIKFRRYNVNKVLKFSVLRKFGDSPTVWNSLKKYIPKNTFSKLKRIYWKTITKEITREELPQEKIAILKKEYKVEVEKLNKLLHKHDLISKDKDLCKIWSYN